MRLLGHRPRRRTFHRTTLKPRTVLCLCTMLLVSCFRTAVPPPHNRITPDALSGQRALTEVERFIALGPRVSGTEGAAKAAAYLRDRLASLGIEPIVDAFEERTPKGPVTFRNVIGVLEGSGEHTVILASHYDTKAGISPSFTGANDSGSSTGLLLELAAVFKNAAPHPHTLLFAFLDGEECIEEYGPHDGLHGSRRLAATLVRNQRAARVTAVLVLDMVGDRDLTVTLPRNSTPHLLALVLDSARQEGARLHFSLAPHAIIDDHVPFLEAGMPAIDIIDFQFGSAPNKNDYWHTDEDTIDKLSAESLETLGRVVIHTVRKL